MLADAVARSRRRVSFIISPMFSGAKVTPGAPQIQTGRSGEPLRAPRSAFARCSTTNACLPPAWRCGGVSGMTPFGFRTVLDIWQGQQGSNPRPTVLETVALPTELYPCAVTAIELLPFAIHCKASSTSVCEGSDFVGECVEVSLRRRIITSEGFLNFWAWLFASYLRLVRLTSRVEISGREELTAALNAGQPVVMVLWHSRLAFSPFMFDLNAGDLCTISSGAHAGRFAGRVQKRFGLQSIALQSRQMNMGELRALLNLLKAGTSVGLAADGPRGPRNEMKLPPLDWARISGAPVMMVTFSVRRFWQWKSWDRLMFPYPFNRGEIRFRRWHVDIPPKAKGAEMEALRARLEADLIALTEEVDKSVGHPGMMT